jgi:hypothetical protein
MYRLTYGKALPNVNERIKIDKYSGLYHEPDVHFAKKCL